MNVRIATTYTISPVFREYPAKYPLERRDFSGEFIGGDRWQIRQRFRWNEGCPVPYLESLAIVCVRPAIFESVLIFAFTIHISFEGGVCVLTDAQTEGEYIHILKIG